MFGDIEIEKINYSAINFYFFKDVDIDKVLESNKIFLVKKTYKHFIGYLYNDNKVKSLHIMLP